MTKKKIAILFSGQARCAPFSHNEYKNTLITETISQHFLNDVFKEKYEYDIFMSADDLHLDNTYNFFGRDHIKNIHLYNTGFYTIPIQNHIPTMEYFIERYNSYYCDDCDKYPVAVAQYYRIYDAFHLMMEYTHGHPETYDYIIRTRFDITYSNLIPSLELLDENPSILLCGNWDKFAIGRPVIMREYCCIVANNFGLYDKDTTNHIFNRSLIEYDNFYQAERIRWTFAPEIQLFCCLFDFCDKNQLDIDSTIKVVENIEIVR